MLLFVLSIGLADSINPVTIAVALYLASTPRPVGRLANFAAGVFALYAAGARPRGGWARWPRRACAR